MGSCLSRLFALLFNATGNKKAPIYALPVEVIQYISVAFLPADAAASLALCSRSMLKILGSQTLRSLALDRHDTERTRFLENLERDLPDWLLCPHCLKFHPVDPNAHPRQLWLDFKEKKCVRVNGVVTIGYKYYIRYENVQLLMRNYRLGRPYEMYLKKLSNRYTTHRPEKSLEGVVTASIVEGELVLQVRYTLKLLKSWDITLIRRTISKLCPHLIDCFVDSIFAQALRCRLRHAARKRPPCIECKGRKQCPECPTSFQVSVRSLEDPVTEIQVDVWRNLGSCKSPFNSRWRRHADPYLPDIDDWQPGRSDRESSYCLELTDEELGIWCAGI